MFNFVQVQEQFHITVELDSRQAVRKGDPAELRESQREALALIGQKGMFFRGV